MRENKERKSAKQRASLKGLRAARLSRRPGTDSCLSFFTLRAAILRSEFSHLPRCEKRIDEPLLIYRRISPKL